MGREVRKGDPLNSISDTGQLSDKGVISSDTHHLMVLSNTTPEYEEVRNRVSDTGR